MNQNHTPGPWAWNFTGREFSLRTTDRGRLIVMGFSRMGMSLAQPTFFKWEGENRERKDGFLVKAQKMGEVHDHPDARLIAFAPDIFAALKAMVEASPCQNRCTLDDMTCATRKAVSVLAMVENKAKVQS